MSFLTHMWLSKLNRWLDIEFRIPPAQAVAWKKSLDTLVLHTLFPAWGIILYHFFNINYTIDVGDELQKGKNLTEDAEDRFDNDNQHCRIVTLVNDDWVCWILISDMREASHNPLILWLKTLRMIIVIHAVQQQSTSNIPHVVIHSARRTQEWSSRTGCVHQTRGNSTFYFVESTVLFLLLLCQFISCIRNLL